ncbi:protein pangolin, isoforms A/H/I/S isoform X2 [Parasteatoda tepidariorum]|uniref:protein pangolin, isoforms A/H/I/S isoform X2 n=1 Tax=Parasteatoda tepidariorum TaxID=114398 RepID=UPI00077F9EBB|nr:protein pangolin, isoforms A/H/I/S isoform X2 [Parasteatoda tepidariorum]
MKTIKMSALVLILADWEKVNRVPLVPSNHAPLSLMQMYNHREFQPPPAHIGIPPIQVDPKTGMRTPVYPLHPPMFSPEFTHQYPWPHHSMYSLSPGFCAPPFPPVNHHMSNKFSPNLSSSSSSPPVILPSLTHPPLVTPKVEMPDSQNSGQLSNLIHHSHHSHSVSSLPQQRNQNSNNTLSSSGRSISERTHNEKKKSHIKKPLNAFMLFMKEQRAQVVAECTLKESAAINQLLGKKWHSLSRDEQSKYYELAKKERQVHMQMYPGWTARDNYAINAKKKKRKKDKSQETDANNPKKCRARFGLDRQSSWCKPCRRKKKCIRYISGSDNTGESEDNIGSVDSLGSLEVPTPDSRFGDDHSDSDSGNGDVDDELEVSSEFSLSSPPVPRPLRDSVQSVGSPASQLFTVQHLSRSAGCLESPETPPSTDSSTTTTAPLHAVT